MRGNCYILVPDTEVNELVPNKLSDKWGFTQPVTDADGNPTDVTAPLHPTWLEAATLLRSYFGDPVDVTYQGNQYTMMEFELSFVNGEIAEVVNLQSDVAGNYDFTIYTASEADEIIKGADLQELLSLRP